MTFSYDDYYLLPYQDTNKFIFYAGRIQTQNPLSTTKYYISWVN